VEQGPKIGNAGSLDDKASISALVSTTEMRLSLRRITEMHEGERKKYAKRFMRQYEEPLTEAGFAPDSFGYHIAELVLSSFNHALFDRTY
jgi:hypothetical protein